MLGFKSMQCSCMTCVVSSSPHLFLLELNGEQVLQPFGVFRRLFDVRSWLESWEVGQCLLDSRNRRSLLRSRLHRHQYHIIFIVIVFGTVGLTGLWLSWFVRYGAPAAVRVSGCMGAAAVF